MSRIEIPKSDINRRKPEEFIPKVMACEVTIDFYPGDEGRPEWALKEDIVHLFNIHFTGETLLYKINKWIAIRMNFDVTGQLNVSGINGSNIAALHSFLDAIGYKGGYNPNGQWENNQGEIISDLDIIADIQKSLVAADLNPVLAFFYKKAGKDGRGYIRCGNVFAPNTEQGWNIMEKEYPLTSVPAVPASERKLPKRTL